MHEIMILAYLAHFRPTLANWFQFCIITPAFKKVKYKFWYSKKSSQKAGSDGPLIWS